MQALAQNLSRSATYTRSVLAYSPNRYSDLDVSQISQFDVRPA